MRTPKIKPPKGYRLLKDGDSISKDAVFTIRGGKWHPVGALWCRSKFNPTFFYQMADKIKP